MHRKYGVKVVVIQDDNFNVDPASVQKFCELKKASNNPIKWVSLGRALTGLIANQFSLNERKWFIYGSFRH